LRADPDPLARTAAERACGKVALGAMTTAFTLRLCGRVPDAPDERPGDQGK
jgi:hypothetical protein